MLLSPLEVPGKYMTYCSCAVEIWLTAHAQQRYDLLLMRSRSMTLYSCSEGLWLRAHAQKWYDLLLMRSRDMNLCSCSAGVLLTAHEQSLLFLCEGLYTLSVKMSDFTV